MRSAIRLLVVTAGFAAMLSACSSANNEANNRNAALENEPHLLHEEMRSLEGIQEHRKGLSFAGCLQSGVGAGHCF